MHDDAIAAAVADDRALYRLVGDLAAFIEIAQALLGHVADVVDQPGKLGVARDDESERDAVRFRARLAGLPCRCYETGR